MLIGLHLNKWLMNLGMKELRIERNDKYINKQELSHRANNSVNVCLCTVLCELDAELREIFACGGEIVSDDWHILFNVHYNGCHIRTLVTNMLHTLPRHLEAEN